MFTYIEMMSGLEEEVDGEQEVVGLQQVISLGIFIVEPGTFVGCLQALLDLRSLNSWFSCSVSMFTSQLYLFCYRH